MRLLGCFGKRGQAIRLPRMVTISHVDAAAGDLSLCIVAPLPALILRALNRDVVDMMHPNRITEFSPVLSSARRPLQGRQCRAGNSPPTPLTAPPRSHQPPFHPLQTSSPSSFLFLKILPPSARALFPPCASWGGQFFFSSETVTSILLSGCFPEALGARVRQASRQPAAGVPPCSKFILHVLFGLRVRVRCTFANARDSSSKSAYFFY